MQESGRVAMKVARASLGVALLIVGIIGLFMPVLPGWLLIIPGLAVLARDFPWAERLHIAVKDRFDRARNLLDGREDGTDAEQEAA